MVLGAGHAGVACAHKAAEMGKKVVLVEKQKEENYQNLGNENGHINSEWQKSHGVPEVDPMVFFNNWQLNSGNRAEPDILSYFCHHSGEVFDWHLSFTPGYDPSAKRGTIFPTSGRLSWEAFTAGLELRIIKPSLKGQLMPASPR